MLYRIGNHAEVMALPVTLPEMVHSELLRCVALFDLQYGLDRDYLEVGGYSILTETMEDTEKVKDIIDYDTHPCEWANRLGEEYLSALYVINNDFAIILFMPLKAAPEAILNELED